MESGSSSKHSKGGAKSIKTASSSDDIDDIMQYAEIVEDLGIVDREGVLKLNLAQMQEELMEREEEERGNEEEAVE